MHTLHVPAGSFTPGINLRHACKSNQVTINKCDPECPGHKLGFRLHDKIVSVNGLGITGKPLYDLFMASYAKGESFTTVLLRQESNEDDINDGSKELGKDGT